MLTIDGSEYKEAGSGYVFEKGLNEEFYFVCDGMDDYTIELN